jgi:long-chain acyl-CoA synthetase
VQTLQSVLRSLGARGDRLAMLTFTRQGVERWSFSALDEHVRRLAAGLARAGATGEPIGLFAPSSPEWVVAALAVLDAAAVLVPIDAHARGDELAHLVRDSGIRRIFTAQEHLHELDAAGQRSRLDIFLLDADARDERSWRRLLAGDRDAGTAARGEDRAAIFYTAGTTGVPKGVPLTHRNCASNLAAMLKEGLAGPDDRVLVPLPFHHVYPFMIGVMLVLAAGAVLVTPAGLTGPQVVRALHEGEVTAIVGVPRLYEALVSGLEARVKGRGRVATALYRGALRLSNLARRVTGLRLGRSLLRGVRGALAPHVRVVASGGAALDPRVASTLEALGWDVATGYGLTETSPILTLNVPGRSRLHTAGRPLAGVELKLDDPDGDGVGEVLARGPGVFAGYLNLPDRTAEAFTDGWFRTGDRGRFDRAGYLELVGRVSEILVLAGGKNVPPEDLERQYAAEPAIREIGLLLRAGRLAAVVVPEPSEVRRRGGPVEPLVRDALGAVSRRLSTWQRVGDYAITHEALPRTRLGKLRRHLLPDIYERARRGEQTEPGARRPARVEELGADDRALLAYPAARAVWDWLTAQYRHERVTPDTSLQLDLGVDSLEWLTVTVAVRERAGVNLTEAQIATVETVRDLLWAAVEAAGKGAVGPVADPLEHPEEVLDADERRWLVPVSGPIRALASALDAINRAVVRGAFAVRAEGVERLPARGQVVLVPNHRSYLDPFVLAAVLPRSWLTRTFWAGWAPLLFRNRLMRFFSRLARVVPVDPERGARSLAMGAGILRRQHNLVWFPEGGRSPTAKLQPFQPGIGMLLERFQVPVVPVFIDGTERALPPGRALPRRARVSVVFGAPLDPRELATRGRADDAAHRISDALRDAVAALDPQTPRARAGAPPDRPSQR